MLKVFLHLLILNFTDYFKLFFCRSHSFLKVMQRLFDSTIRIDHAAKCLCACSSGVCFSHSNLFFVWFLGEDGPRDAMEFPFAPAVMCSFEDRVLLACSDSLILLSLDDQDVAVEDLSVPPSGTVLFPLISFGCFDSSGERALIASMNFVTIVHIGESMTLVNVDCSPYLGADMMVSLAGFGPASSIFLVSKNNHLVCVNTTDWELQRDVGIVCSASVVTSMLHDPKTGGCLSVFRTVR